MNSRTELRELRDAVARKLGVKPSEVDAGWSDNGDADWSRPVFVTFGDGYGLCDLDAAPFREQVAFLVEQVMEGVATCNHPTEHQGGDHNYHDAPSCQSCGRDLCPFCGKVE